MSTAPKQQTDGAAPILEAAGALIHTRRGNGQRNCVGKQPQTRCKHPQRLHQVIGVGVDTGQGQIGLPGERWLKGGNPPVEVCGVGPAAVLQRKVAGKLKDQSLIFR